MTTVTTPAKVARNLTRSFFEMGHKRCNSSDHISMSEICARELRATLLGNQPDWKPTHETAAWVHWYNTRRPHLALGGITPQQAENQHTTTRKEAASTSLHKTRDLTRRVRVVVSPGVVLLVLRVVLLAWLGLGRRAVVRRRMRRGGVTMRWCVWMAWMSPLLV